MRDHRAPHPFSIHRRSVVLFSNCAPTTRRKQARPALLCSLRRQGLPPRVGRRAPARIRSMIGCGPTVDDSFKLRSVVDSLPARDPISARRRDETRGASAVPRDGERPNGKNFPLASIFFPARGARLRAARRRPRRVARSLTLRATARAAARKKTRKFSMFY